MKKAVTLLIAFGAVVSLSAASFATIIHVPADQPTIQAGIDAAITGDTVLVADGTYTGNGNRDIDFGGKGIVLKSENGPDFTILDCQGSLADPHRGFAFRSGEDSTAVVDGFTIQGGFGLNDGPGGYSVGGGIKCDTFSSPSLINNTISGNSAGGGGGIYCGSSSDPTISYNTISGNSGFFGGGGIYCRDYSSPTISNNTISDNSASGYGGGIYGGGSIINNTISGNSASGGGGGIYCGSSSDPTISYNTISGNSGFIGGGGIYGGGSIINNTISGNSASGGGGGGIYCVGFNATISSNTISGNSAESGGGIYCSASTTITNSIIWGNAGSQIYGSPIITYCDIAGGWEGEGNINVNPLFVDADNGNYNVCSQSPCIDAGDPDTLDPDGTRSDIGVFYPDHPECSFGNIWYVSTGGNDTTGDGSPGNPFGTIQHAINVSFHLDSVIVENGTYVEQINFSGKSILVASNYIFSRDTLDIQNTIIDGDSVSTVVTFDSYEDSVATITGFTIRNGGPGVLCHFSNPTISYNNISGNTASSGGGVYCSYSSPTISNNTISGNSANSGGGISCEWDSSPTITNNTISGNSGNYYGGGIYCLYYSSPTISNNTISGNSANSGGGGIYCSFSSPTISNNTISGNSADTGGGLYLARNSSPSLENSIIAFNSDTTGAIFCDGNSNPVLTCCDVYGNAGGDWVGCIADQADSNGNFSLDPLFCDTAAGDFSLSKFSPCLPQYNSCGVLIGALDLGCTGPYVCGDANGDSLVNQADVAFLQAFYFDCSSCPYPLGVADVNCDGSVDLADIIYLAAYLNGIGPEPCCW